MPLTWVTAGSKTSTPWSDPRILDQILVRVNWNWKESCSRYPSAVSSNPSTPPLVIWLVAARNGEMGVSVENSSSTSSTRYGASWR